MRSRLHAADAAAAIPVAGSPVTLVTLPIAVTCRSIRDDIPAHVVQGFVPFPDAPLAVTPVSIWHGPEKAWKLQEPEAWKVTHRATGFKLGPQEWPTVEEAMAFLMRCDPTFAAWSVVDSGKPSPALLAVKAKVRWAAQEAAV